MDVYVIMNVIVDFLSRQSLKRQHFSFMATKHNAGRWLGTRTLIIKQLKKKTNIDKTNKWVQNNYNRQNKKSKKKKKLSSSFQNAQKNIYI